MNPEDAATLSRRVFEAARGSTDSESLEEGLWSVINEYSDKFPNMGRALALHEVTSFMFNNDARHFPFFHDIALMAYDANAEISKWHDAEIIAEHMMGFQVELLLNQIGNEEDLKSWFGKWCKAVEEWASNCVNEESWPYWGTGVLNKCEMFSKTSLLREDVHKFWNSMIDVYGSFAPLDETLQRHEDELLQNAQLVLRELDLAQQMKSDFTNRVRLLHRLEVEDLVDRMNILIEYAPKRLSDGEIEVELNFISKADNIAEASQLTNDLATRLRLQGDIEKGVEILSSALELSNEVTETQELAFSALKLAIYLDEMDRKEEAKSWFKKIADAEHGPDSVSIEAVQQACQRYSALLIEEGRIAESKEYTIRHNALAEMMGDPYLFVRSCFNIVTDCHELGQGEEAEEWFLLGMINLRDGINTGPMGPISPQHQQQLLEQSSNVSELIGQKHAWTEMMQHIFGDE
jgi:hypothetical protein